MLWTQYQPICILNLYTYHHSNSTWSIQTSIHQPFFFLGGGSEFINLKCRINAHKQDKNEAPPHLSQIPPQPHSSIQIHYFFLTKIFQLHIQLQFNHTPLWLSFFPSFIFLLCPIWLQLSLSLSLQCQELFKFQVLLA